MNIKKKNHLLTRTESMLQVILTMLFFNGSMTILAATSRNYLPKRRRYRKESTTSIKPPMPLQNVMPTVHVCCYARR